MAWAVVACSYLPLYSHYEYLGADGWQRGDTVTFTVPVGESTTCGLRLGLRASDAYPYTQVVVEACTRTANSDVCRIDTVALNVTDNVGNSTGQGLMMHHCQCDLPSVTLADADTLIVSVTHIMSRHLLPGITDVGLTVEKTQ